MPQARREEEDAKKQQQEQKKPGTAWADRLKSFML